MWPGRSGVAQGLCWVLTQVLPGSREADLSAGLSGNWLKCGVPVAISGGHGRGGSGTAQWTQGGVFSWQPSAAAPWPGRAARGAGLRLQVLAGCPGNQNSGAREGQEATPGGGAEGWLRASCRLTVHPKGSNWTNSERFYSFRNRPACEAPRRLCHSLDWPVAPTRPAGAWAPAPALLCLPSARGVPALGEPPQRAWGPQASRRAALQPVRPDPSVPFAFLGFCSFLYSRVV